MKHVRDCGSCVHRETALTTIEIVEKARPELLPAYQAMIDDAARLEHHRKRIEAMGVDFDSLVIGDPDKQLTGARLAMIIEVDMLRIQASEDILTKLETAEQRAVDFIKATETECSGQVRKLGLFGMGGVTICGAPAELISTLNLNDTLSYDTPPET